MRFEPLRSRPHLAYPAPPRCVPSLAAPHSQLDNPNPASVAYTPAYELYTQSRKAYSDRIRRDSVAYAAKYKDQIGS